MSAIDDLLETCRRDLDRVTARDLPAEVAGGALVVDTRPVEQRLRDGELPGAVVVDRNVLEWRLDPTSPYRMPEATSADIRVIVVCDEGYSSSLVAHTLRGSGCTAPRTSSVVTRRGCASGRWTPWQPDGPDTGPGQAGWPASARTLRTTATRLARRAAMVVQ